MAGHIKFLLVIFFCIGIPCTPGQNTDKGIDVVHSQPEIDLIDSLSYLDGVVNVKFNVVGIEHEFKEICNFYYLEIVGGQELVLLDDLCSHCNPVNESAGFSCSVIISGDPELKFECKITVKPTGGAIYRERWMHQALTRPGLVLGALKAFPICFKAGCAAQADAKKLRADSALTPTIFFPPDGAVLMPRDFLLEFDLAWPTSSDPPIFWAVMVDGRDLFEPVPARGRCAAVAVPALAIGDHALRVEVRDGGGGGGVVAAADAAIVVAAPSPIGEECRKGCAKSRAIADRCHGEADRDEGGSRGPRGRRGPSISGRRPRAATPRPSTRHLSRCIAFVRPSGADPHRHPHPCPRGRRPRHRLRRACIRAAGGRGSRCCRRSRHRAGWRRS